MSQSSTQLLQIVDGINHRLSNTIMEKIYQLVERREYIDAKLLIKTYFYLDFTISCNDKGEDILTYLVNKEDEDKNDTNEKYYIIDTIFSFVDLNELKLTHFEPHQSVLIKLCRRELFPKIYQQFQKEKDRPEIKNEIFHCFLKLQEKIDTISACYIAMIAEDHPDFTSQVYLARKIAIPNSKCVNILHYYLITSQEQTALIYLKYLDSLPDIKQRTITELDVTQNNALMVAIRQKLFRVAYQIIAYLKDNQLHSSLFQVNEFGKSVFDLTCQHENDELCLQLLQMVGDKFNEVEKCMFQETYLMKLWQSLEYLVDNYWKAFEENQTERKDKKGNFSWCHFITQVSSQDSQDPARKIAIKIINQASPEFLFQINNNSAYKCPYIWEHLFISLSVSGTRWMTRNRQQEEIVSMLILKGKTYPSGLTWKAMNMNHLTLEHYLSQHKYQESLAILQKIIPHEEDTHDITHRIEELESKLTGKISLV